MLDQAGARRIRYEDVFRALGHYLDANMLHPAALAETPDGFVLKVDRRLQGAGIEADAPILFTNDDIDALLETAYLRRRSARSEHVPPLRREPLYHALPSVETQTPATAPNPAPAEAPLTPAGRPALPKMPNTRGWLRRS